MTIKQTITIDADEIIMLQDDPSGFLYQCTCPNCDMLLQFDMKAPAFCSCGMSWDVMLKATGKKSNDDNQMPMDL